MRPTVTILLLSADLIRSAFGPALISSRILANARRTSPPSMAVTSPRRVAVVGAGMGAGIGGGMGVSLAVESV